MTVPEICEFAGHGIKPTDMTNMEELLWYRVRDIYLAHEAGAITAAEGKSRKSRAILDFNADRAAIEGGKAAMKRTAELFARVELACARWRKTRDPEAADALIVAIHGC